MVVAGVGVWDVNGGDRRGIEWDERRRVFRLNEWEHAETERRMNAKERGSEFVRRRKMFFLRAFFPEDVTPDYYSFTAWRFAQRCVSATVGVFGTQALLLALGVKAGRIGQAAAISWVLKDGLGRVGKMLWASGMGKDFDVDPKRWRFRSALLYAMGNGMEIVTQIFPASFLVVATLANSMKQVSMLTSSATRNAMYRSFGGRAQNIANITAKGEAQIVVADLIGMGCGIYLSKRIGTSKPNVLAAYTILTSLDIFGIYMELRQVVFRTLNAERCSLIIEEFVRNDRILVPSDVSNRERIFLKPRYKSRSRFSSIAKAARDPAELELLMRVFRKERFLVGLPAAGRRGRRGPCRVVLRNDAKHEDVLRALLTVGYLLDRRRSGNKLGWLNGSNGGPESALRSAQRAANKAAPGLIEELRKRGWNVDNLLFGTVKRGASWGTARPNPAL
jgi:Vitamin B6 photo-protection and homoeostasis